MVCKPNSVPSSGGGHCSWIAITGDLQRPTRNLFIRRGRKPHGLLPSGLAGGHPGTPGLRWPPTGVGPTHRFPIWSCTRWGLSCRLVSPPPRCALTAPFHPCHPDGSDRTRRPDGPEFGGLFSVTLSLARGYGAPAPSPRTGGRYPPPCPVVFGLSCPRHAGGRPPDHSLLHYTAGRQVWRRVAGFSGCMRMSAGKSARSKRCKLGSPQSDCR